jgi:hypothetical protein
MPLDFIRARYRHAGMALANRASHQSALTEEYAQLYGLDGIVALVVETAFEPYNRCATVN